VQRQRKQLEFFLKELLKCLQYICYILLYYILSIFCHNKKREWSRGQAHALTCSCFFLTCLWVQWRAKKTHPTKRRFIFPRSRGVLPLNTWIFSNIQV